MLRFWDRWGDLVQRLLASTGSLASLVALVLVFADQPIKVAGGTLALVLAAVGLAIPSICLEVRSELRLHQHRRVYAREDTAGIKAYMRNWIGSSGRAAIWTRDLSWVNDDETRNLLKAKAAHGDLTLCMPQTNELSASLKASGADVCIYGGRGFDTPASRFTIAYLGNGGTQIAIGRTDKGEHVIEELDSSHPALHMAMDLVAIAKALAAKQDS